jgi:hypothetical protein
MDDSERSDPEYLVQSRVAPLLYVLDGDGQVLFASDGRPGINISADVSATLAAAVRRIQAGETSPLLHDGKLVRSERLAAAEGSECYAVFFERLAIRRDSDGADAPAPDAEQAAG